MIVSPAVEELIPSPNDTVAASQAEVIVPVVNTGNENTVTETGEAAAEHPLALLTVTE